MVVKKEPQVLADDEQMVQPFVHQLKIGDLFPRLGI